MTDRDWIVDRIGAPAFDQLATELAGSDLHSVLLEVMQRRAASRSPADVLAHYERDPFCAPAIVDLRESHAVDGHLLAAANGFEALGLSPVAPLGASSAMAHTGQNRVLSALRMMEVVSDSTNVLALECARRLRGRLGRAGPSRDLSPCAPHPAAAQAAWALATFQPVRAGQRRARGEGPCFHGGHPASLHIRTMLRALERLEQHGYSFGTPRVDHPRDVRADGRRRSNCRSRSTSATDSEAAGARLLLGWTALSDLGHRTGWRRGSADRRRRIRLADQACCQPPGGVHRDRRGRPTDRFAFPQGRARAARDE